MPTSEPLLNASYFFVPPEWRSQTDKLAVLFHGLTGSPSEMFNVAEALCSEGFKVIVPCLPGHCTSISELRRTPVSEFISYGGSVLKNISVAPSIIGGLSFGSLMTLWCAEHTSPAPRALVLLAPPFRIRSVDRILGVLSFLPDSWLNPLWLKTKADRPILQKRNCYAAHSIASVVRLIKLRRNVVRGLKQLRMPVLMVQDPFDHHLEAAATEKAVEYFGSDEVDTMWMPHAEHELTEGPKAEAVCGAIVEFVRRAMSH